MQKYLNQKNLIILFSTLGGLLLISLIYWSITAGRAARQHLKNEKAVAQKLAKGELKITTDNDKSE